MHIPTILSTPGVSLAALVDSDSERCRAMAARFGVARTASRVGDVAESLDAVVVATPPHAHAAATCESLESGLHVLCEKPMAGSVRECEAMIAAAGASGKVLAVGHMFRFYPVRERLFELIAAHQLGAIESVQVTEGKPYNWPARSGYTFRRELVSGGVLINAGVHMLDAFLAWFGDPLSFEYEDDSLGGLESNARVRLRFPDNLRVRFRQSRTCLLPYEMNVVCESGTLAMATTSLTSYRVIRGEETREYSCAGDARTPADCSVKQLQDFVNAATTGSAPRVDGREGARVVRLVESLYATKAARPVPHTAPQPGLTW